MTRLMLTGTMVGGRPVAARLVASGLRSESSPGREEPGIAQDHEAADTNVAPKASASFANLTKEEARKLSGKLAEQFVQAYNNHDVKAVMSLHAEKTQRIRTQGRETARENRPEIESSLTDTFKQHSKVKLQVDITTAEFVTPEVLRTEGTYVMTDGPSESSDQGEILDLSPQVRRPLADHFYPARFSARGPVSVTRGSPEPCR